MKTSQISASNKFKKKPVSFEPFVGPDGTLIFQHPTVPNYYENSDKPELKPNPYSNIMYYPHYDPYFYNNGIPYPPGAVPPHEQSKMSSQTKTKQKNTDLSETGNAPSIQESEADQSKYIYASLNKSQSRKSRVVKAISPYQPSGHHYMNGYPNGYFH